MVRNVRYSRILRVKILVYSERVGFETKKKKKFFVRIDEGL